MSHVLHLTCSNCPVDNPCARFRLDLTDAQVPNIQQIKHQITLLAILFGRSPECCHACWGTAPDIEFHYNVVSLCLAICCTHGSH